MKLKPAFAVFVLLAALCSYPLKAQQTVNFDVRGQLRPINHTVLAAGIAGRIDVFKVVVGTQVEKGDMLLEMDCREVEAQLAISAAQIQAANSRHTVNERLADANNISLLEYDLSLAALAVARAERQKVLAQQQFCLIEAPFSGVVTNKSAQAFQHVQIGQPLLEIIDNSSLEVEAVVPSSWLSQNALDRGFTILIDETNTAHQGKFDRTAGVVDPVSQTVRLIGHLIEPPSQLIAGMSGKISLVDAQQ